MTHDTHASGSNRSAGRRHARPDLGRPSLFADFDQDLVEDVEPQRIRLLSTLESQRGARARPRGQRRATGHAHPWLTRGLMVMMGLGMLVMLLSFMQLLRRPPPALPTAAIVEAPTTAASQAAQTVVATFPPTSPAESVSEAAEIIEFDPPATGAPQALTSTAGAAKHERSSAEIAMAAVKASAAAPTTGPASSATERPARIARNTTSRQAQAVREARAAPDDVALVEAMLAHAGPRPAPPSPTEALRRCGQGTAPETSVCRARICVQHPALAACHTP